MVFENATMEEVESKPKEARLLKFNGVGDRDVYNPSVPIVNERGEVLIAGRVEARPTERGSEVHIFKLAPNHEWDDVVKLPQEEGISNQDPFVTKIGKQLVLGCVKVRWEGDKSTYWTAFYKWDGETEFEEFAQGPMGMKDIRLVDLEGGRVGIFTRPQGEKGGRGKIGFTVIETLDDLNEGVVEKADLITNQFGSDVFGDENWGGVNQAILQPDGTILVIGHRAEWVLEDGPQSQNKIRIYHAIEFYFDPRSRKSTKMVEIANIEDFPEIEPKNPRLKKVVFTAGVVQKADGTRDLYAGLGDSHVGCKNIDKSRPSGDFDY